MRYLDLSAPSLRQPSSLTVVYRLAVVSLPTLHLLRQEADTLLGKSDLLEIQLGNVGLVISAVQSNRTPFHRRCCGMHHEADQVTKNLRRSQSCLSVP
jgi:hypothetical protein